MQGADIIDIGAASTRPNAPVIEENEEWLRLKEILPLLRAKYPKIIISVDTYRASIAEKAADTSEKQRYIAKAEQALTQLKRFTKGYDFSIPRYKLYLGWLGWLKGDAETTYSAHLLDSVESANNIKMPYEIGFNNYHMGRILNSIKHLNEAEQHFDELNLDWEKSWFSDLNLSEKTA